MRSWPTWGLDCCLHPSGRWQRAPDDRVDRFRQDARPLHKAEGAFLLCGFWLAQAAAVRGDEVAHWFERNSSASGPAALYAEEYDVHQRQLRGNLPQAFVHAAMLATAARLSAAGTSRLHG
jgi:GH15 family glucan-1,4-alpha-glucosidase